MPAKPTYKRPEDQLELVIELANQQLIKLENQSPAPEQVQQIKTKRAALNNIRPLVVHAFELHKALQIAKECMGNPAAMIFRSEYLRAFNRVLRLSKPIRPYNKRVG